MSRFEIPPVGLRAPVQAPDADRVIDWARTVARSVPFRGLARLPVYAGARWQLYVLPSGAVQAVFRAGAMAHSFQAVSANVLAARIEPPVLAELAARIADGRAWRELPRPS
jgi:hypothetical protein